MRELTLEELELIAGGTDSRDPGTDEPPIVVIGGGDNGDGGDWGDWGDSGDDWGDWGDQGDGGGDYGDGGGQDGPEAPNDTNPPQVTGGIVNLHNAAKVQAAVEAMQAKIAAINPQVQALSDTATIQLPDGTIMSGAEFKQLWNTIDFVVTDQTFGQDRSGAYDSESRTSAITADAVNGWNAWEGGLSFIIFHEVAHSSAQAHGVEVAMWEAHLAAGGTAANYNASSPYFQENEEFVNVAARNAMAAAGIALDPNFSPTNGYEYGDLTQ